MIPSPTRRWLLFALVVTAGILNYVDRQIIAVLKPLIEVDMGWSDRDYGTLASLFQFSAAVAFIFTGWIVDRLGVKWANPIGVAAWSIAAMAHGWARSMIQFALCRVALGATEAMGTPTQIKTIATIFPPNQRSTGYGLGNAASNMGAIVTPLMIPLVAAAWGWRGAFVAAGILGFVWAAAWLLVTRGLDLAPPPPEACSPADPTPAYGAVIRERRTWAIAIAKALSDQTWWLLLFWMPDFFHRTFGLSVAELGPPLAVVYTCAAAGSLAAGAISTRLLDRGYGVNAVRKGSMLVCGLLVLPVPLALYTSDYWVAVAFLGLTLAAHQGFSTNMFALIADIVPQAKVGSVTSFGALIGNLAGMNILFVAGVLLANGYGYLPLFLVASVSYLLGLAWIQLLLPRLERVEDAART
ncbi:MFS transporter [Sphingomonas profundi]|uniref:MFS transporter n=1 Tax=Alterirhizorhabdus profundi TaxID=2681549 RepID=UPI0012E8C76B|nr:MFS transporter [Sphingomonas profundi]